MLSFYSVSYSISSVKVERIYKLFRAYTHVEKMRQWKVALSRKRLRGQKFKQATEPPDYRFLIAQF